MAKGKRIEDLAADLLAHTTLRARSLIVTVFGDAVAPHGGTVWLGSLIALLAPFGVNERLVRTAVLRLSREGWLVSRQIGRRSYYSLTEGGRRRFDDAHRKIYAFEPTAWSGEWHIVFIGPGKLPTAKRERLKSELNWQGFGNVGPNLLAHPSADPQALHHVLQDLGVTDRVAIMRATGDALTSEGAMRELVRSAWNLDGLSGAYRGFLDRFRPVRRALEVGGGAGPAASFLIRVMAIHEYRRVLLRDPQLPAILLPEDWAGAGAHQLCREIYRRAAAAAEWHLTAILEGPDGPLPGAEEYFYRRFGGLEHSAQARVSAAE
jgi:phenylacetic acid degradation operon negative regulatory protein